MIQKRFIPFILFAVVALGANTLRAQWVQTNGPTGRNITALAINDTNLIAGAIRQGVFSSTDNGTSWAGIDTDYYVTSFAVIGTKLFAGIAYGVLLSTNNGASWTDASIGLPTSIINAFLVSGTYLYAATSTEGVFLTTDSGKSWVSVNNGLPYDKKNGIYTNVLSLTGSNGDLFVGTNDSGAFVSSNNGISWNAAGLKGSYISSFTYSGATLFAGTASGVFHSTDNGTNWIAANSGVTNAFIYAFATKGTILFAGTLNNGVFLSSDNGSNWNAVNTGLADTQVMSIVISDEYLFAGTNGSGVWRRPLSEMIGQSAVPDLQPVSQQIQSYPNPFSQSTQISFTSESAGYADISIVNLLGEQVARLFSGEMGAGEHSFIWSNPASLPDGTYECLVRINGQVETLPIVLIR